MPLRKGLNQSHLVLTVFSGVQIGTPKPGPFWETGETKIKPSLLTGGHWASLSAATSCTFRCLLWDFPLDLTSLCKTWITRCNRRSGHNLSIFCRISIKQNASGFLDQFYWHARFQCFGRWVHVYSTCTFVSGHKWGWLSTQQHPQTSDGGSLGCIFSRNVLCDIPACVDL